MATTKVLSVRVSDDLHTDIGAICARSGMTPSQVVRLALVALMDRVPNAALRQCAVPAEVRASIGDLTREVRRVGVNLNQVLTVAHLAGADAGFLAEIGAVLSDLQALPEMVSEAVINREHHEGTAE